MWISLLFFEKTPRLVRGIVVGTTQELTTHLQTCGSTLKAGLP
jgi:hypothetical protein